LIGSICFAVLLETEKYILYRNIANMIAQVLKLDLILSFIKKKKSFQLIKLYWFSSLTFILLKLGKLLLKLKYQSDLKKEKEGRIQMLLAEKF